MATELHAAYLIDGYNLLHALGVLQGKVGPGGLEHARLRLLGLLAGAFGAEVGRVTVVFDGVGSSRARQAAAEEWYKDVRVLFALGEQEADDVIEAILRERGNAKQLAVVSDDRRLKDAARRRRATPLACGDFIDLLGRVRRTIAHKAADKTPSDKDDGRQEAQPDGAEIARWRQEFAGIEADPALKEAFEHFDIDED